MPRCLGGELAVVVTSVAAADPRLSTAMVIGRGNDRGQQVPIVAAPGGKAPRNSHAVTSDKIWNHGNIAAPGSKAANMVNAAKTLKVKKTIDKDTAKAGREEAARVKWVAQNALGMSPAVQEKLRVLRVGEPSRESLSKAFTADELKGLLVANQGIDLRGQKPALVERVHVLLWPELNRPTLMLTNHQSGTAS